MSVLFQESVRMDKLLIVVGILLLINATVNGAPASATHAEEENFPRPPDTPQQIDGPEDYPPERGLDDE